MNDRYQIMVVNTNRTGKLCPECHKFGVDSTGICYHCEQDKADKMEIITKPKGGGKTTDLIKMAYERGGYIVCRNCAEVDRIHSEAHKLGFYILFPLTYKEFIDNAYHGSNIKEFYIDNAEDLLQQLTAVNIKAITLNVPDSE